MPEEDNLELEEKVVDDEVTDFDAKYTLASDEETIGDEPEELDQIFLQGEEPPKEEERDPNNTENAVIKSFRAREKELKRKLQEVQALANQVQTQPKVEDIGPEPDLADPDVEYDKDKFKRKLLEWNAKKLKLDEVQNKVKAEQEAAAKAWNDKVSSYDKAKKSLRVADFDDAEEAVKELFTREQQSIILDGAKRPEELIYAIGKRPELAKKLAGEKSLARFAMEIGVLETKIMSTRKEAPAPERVVRSTGGSPLAGGKAAIEKELERARASGDYNKVLELKRKLNK